MVALQADPLEAVGRRCHEMVEHAGGIGAEVDVVAEHDDVAPARRRGGIRGDPLLQFQEFRPAAVHVSNSVDDRFLREHHMAIPGDGVRPKPAGDTVGGNFHQQQPGR